VRVKPAARLERLEEVVVLLTLQQLEGKKEANILKEKLTEKRVGTQVKAEKKP
jgi:hypothetical protein